MLGVMLVLVEHNHGSIALDIEKYRVGCATVGGKGIYLGIVVSGCPNV